MGFRTDFVARRSTRDPDGVQFAGDLRRLGRQFFQVRLRIGVFTRPIGMESFYFRDVLI